MKIGFFGGCFNPPTNVHIDIANELISNKIVNKVIFIPIGDFYKKENLIPINNRCKMLEIVISKHKNLELDDFEKNVKSTIYAKDAFEFITKKYKDDEIFFIMGSDNFLKMSNWEEFDKIINLYNYIVIKRDNAKLENKQENVHIFTPLKAYNYDSTIVRKRICEGKNVENYIDKSVLEYIKNNRLYIS